MFKAAGLAATTAPTGRLSAACALMLQAIARGCAVFPPLGIAARSDRLKRHVDAGAWTDAALLLVGLELPDWGVRRLEWDDGEWFCSLARHPRVPSEFGDEVDGRNRLLPLAIIDAMIEAKRRFSSGAPASCGSDWERQADYEKVWCDNCS